MNKLNNNNKLNNKLNFDVPVTKGRTWYSLKNELRPFISGTS